jgi:hypothetical protein
MGTKPLILNVQGVEIRVASFADEDYISLTDMVSGFDGGSGLIDAWLRNKNTLEFLSVWERINNPTFNSLEFEGIKSQAGLNRFAISVKQWTQRTSGIGLIAKAGRYGGTFGHRDIAFEFGSWLRPEFKLYLLKEFQRLKTKETSTSKLDWSVRTLLAKTQYRTHTDAVKAHLIPIEVSDAQAALIYASEADILNVALFGCTAKEWRASNEGRDGNIRDAATVEQLVVLASLESQNALLIEQGRGQNERLSTLNRLARKQMQALLNNSSVKKLNDKNGLLE